MDKFKEIRPIALGVAVKDGKLLVSEGYDKKKGTTFYRCIGGGIEFLEKSSDALKREFMEELGIDISVGNLLGVAENIFTYEGKDGHELVFYYDVTIQDENYKDIYKLVEGDSESTAVWIDINDFKNKSKILYPEAIFKYL